ncbi:hypothetical protein [Chitinimonas sp. BJYL2]|uniref:hypothetical protein n=1 Tax=Chitinimonas sp. BJYL2 TaxID=2976696 RepID=UPI0022B3286A|nr:hypothetical protein [Chitinimonas sp. BJYL2]
MRHTLISLCLLCGTTLPSWADDTTPSWVKVEFKREDGKVFSMLTEAGKEARMVYDGWTISVTPTVTAGDKVSLQLRQSQTLEAGNGETRSIRSPMTPVEVKSSLVSKADVETLMQAARSKR